MKASAFFRQYSAREPFSRMAPKLGAFFQEYLEHEKVIRFGEQHVLNTHFPPYPSRAFDMLVENFTRVGTADDRRLHSVTLAVTNRCDYNCWHCYNAGRSQSDVSLSSMRSVVRQLQDLGSVMVALSGGEPLLRDDLEEIVGAFDDRTCLTLNTTGDGLSRSRRVYIDRCKRPWLI